MYFDHRANQFPKLPFPPRRDLIRGHSIFGLTCKLGGPVHGTADLRVQNSDNPTEWQYLLAASLNTSGIAGQSRRFKWHRIRDARKTMKNRMIYNSSNGSLVEIRPTIVPRLGQERWKLGLGLFALTGLMASVSFQQLWSGLGSIPQEFPGGGREYDRGSWQALLGSWVLFIPASIGVVACLVFLLWNGLVRESIRIDGNQLAVTRTLFGTPIYEKLVAWDDDTAVNAESTERNNTSFAFGFWDVSLRGVKYVTVKSGEVKLEFGVCLTAVEADEIAEFLRAQMTPTAL